MGPTWFLPVDHFDLCHSTCVAGTPSTALLGGGAYEGTSAPHWIRSWASPNEWVSIEKQARAMIKKKDLWSAYCPTGGCTHLPLFAKVMSTARPLHSYVYPSITNMPT